MKSKAAFVFYCYTDPQGMQRQITGPRAPEGEIDPDPDQEKLVLETEPPAEEVKEPAETEAESEEAAQTVGLTMTGEEKAIWTGKILRGDVTLTKGEVRDLLDAEALGMRAMFVLELKDN